MSSNSTSPISISVVIPFYNAEDYFAECIDSILKQTYPAAEIIVVNDSPSEQSIAFLNQYKSTCRIVHLDRNHGVSHARNIAIKNAKYEWIAFMDADDIWEPEKLALQKAALERHPEWSAVHTGIKKFSGDQIVAVYTDKPAVLTMDHVLVNGHVVPSSLMLRKDVFDMMGGFDESMRSYEDYDLIVKLVQRNLLIGFIPQALAGLRRQNHNNLTSSWKGLFVGHYQLFRKHWRLFLGHGGVHVTRKFIGGGLQITGGKRGGLFGRILYLTGRLLAWPDK